jgi:hypothetical protein
MDPFDEVRATAANILHRMLEFLTEVEASKTIREQVWKGLRGSREMLGQRQRADLADGFGRLNSLWFGVCRDPNGLIFLLLDELEHDLRIADADLNTAVASAPIHGYLIALRQKSTST